ncbi:hypothetical protein [Azospirillum melinis]
MRFLGRGRCRQDLHGFHGLGHGFHGCRGPRQHSFVKGRSAAKFKKIREICV